MPYWVTNTTIQPFNDTANYYGKNVVSTTTGGMNTAGLDPYREGVYLRTTTDVFRSVQPKMFVCDGQQGFNTTTNNLINHESAFQTYGQSVDFVQFFGTSLFNDDHKGYERTRANNNNIQISPLVSYLIDNGNIADGLLDANQVYPIYLNGGPQFTEEATIEPLPIAYKLPTNESPQELARGFFAFFEDGNYGDERRFGANQIEQLQYRDQPLVVRPYLEYGSVYLIVTASGKTQVVNIKPSAIPDQSIVPRIKPWLDEPPARYFPSLISGSLGLISSLIEGTPYYYEGYKNTDSELQNRDQRSSTAGFTCYGGNFGLYGTDSVAFGGLYRG
jgi:hypothetical protein